MRDVVKLVPVRESIASGNIRKTPDYSHAKTVFCTAKSVGEKEFYDSTQAGFDLSLKLELWSWDYDGQGIAVYDGTEYRVVRAFENSKNRMAELSCERLKGRDA